MSHKANGVSVLQLARTISSFLSGFFQSATVRDANLAFHSADRAFRKVAERLSLNSGRAYSRFLTSEL